MIRSATDFLPRVISTLTNFATSTLLNFGSGRISRLGTSLRRGMVLSRFRSLGSVFRASLLPVLDALSVERTANDVVAHARQVLDPAAANQDDRVLLQVVALAADVADDFEAVGEAHLGNLAKRRILRTARGPGHREARSPAARGSAPSPRRRAMFPGLPPACRTGRKAAPPRSAGRRACKRARRRRAEGRSGNTSSHARLRRSCAR